MRKLPRQISKDNSSVDLGVISDKPVSPPDEPDPKTTKELDDLDAQERKARLEGFVQDVSERKRYAGRVYWLVAGWLVGIFVVLLLQGLLSPWGWFSLSENVLLAVIGGTTINIIGIFLGVVRYLFPKR